MDMDRAKELVLLEAVRKLQMARMGMDKRPMMEDAQGHLDVAMALLTVLEAVK